MSTTSELPFAASSTTPVARSESPTFRRPLPLSAAQEAEVKDLYYKRVRNRCAKEIKGCYP